MDLQERLDEISREELKDSPLLPIIKYAAKSRTAYELAVIPVEDLPSYLSEEKAKDGIPVNWNKIKERVWVPNQFLDEMLVPDKEVLSSDDYNLFVYYEGPLKKEEPFVRNEVLGVTREPDLKKVVICEHDYRQKVKRYAVIFKDLINERYVPVLTKEHKDLGIEIMRELGKDLKAA